MKVGRKLGRISDLKEPNSYYARHRERVLERMRLKRLEERDLWRKKYSQKDGVPRGTVNPNQIHKGGKIRDLLNDVFTRGMELQRMSKEERERLPLNHTLKYLDSVEKKIMVIKKRKGRL